jgi:hypothetical protein
MGPKVEMEPIVLVIRAVVERAETVVTLVTLAMGAKVVMVVMVVMVETQGISV